MEIEVYSPTVLEARCLKSRVGRAVLTLEAPGKGPSLPLPA